MQKSCLENKGISDRSKSRYIIISVLDANFTINYCFSQDFQTIHWEPYMHGETNITGIRIFDPHSKEMRELVKFWNEMEGDLLELTGDKVHVSNMYEVMVTTL